MKLLVWIYTVIVTILIGVLAFIFGALWSWTVTTPAPRYRSYHPGDGPRRGTANYEGPTTRTPVRKPSSIDEYLLPTREEAELVIDTLRGMEHRPITVANFKDVLGLATTFEDQAWGWREPQLAKFGVERVRDGYLITRPVPSPLG